MKNDSRLENLRRSGKTVISFPHCRRTWLKRKVTSIVRPPIYTYLPAKWGVETLRTRRLKMCDVLSTNDVFEYDWKLLFPQSTLLEMRKDLAKTEVSRYQREYAEEMKFVSCCETSTNTILWSHYAERHAGICLGLCPRFRQINEGALQPVIYDTQEPFPCAFESSGTTPSDTSDLVLRLDRLFRTKKAEWASEKEVRLQCVVESPRVEKDVSEHWFFRLDPPEIVSVTFGCRCATEAIGSAIIACNHMGIQPRFERIEIDYETLDLTVRAIPAKDLQRYVDLSILHAMKSI